MVTYLGLQRLWRPPAETLEAIGVALGDHWRAAAGAGPLKLFRSAPVNWLILQGQRTRRSLAPDLK